MHRASERQDRKRRASRAEAAACIFQGSPCLKRRVVDGGTNLMYTIKVRSMGAILRRQQVECWVELGGVLECQRMHQPQHAPHERHSKRYMSATMTSPPRVPPSQRRQAARPATRPSMLPPVSTMLPGPCRTQLSPPRRRTRSSTS
jgi:hypothetical protein